MALRGTTATAPFPSARVILWPFLENKHGYSDEQQGDRRVEARFQKPAAPFPEA